jgi:hypothetical protein
MTMQIRHQVFETNSSSSHSVTVSGQEAEDFGLGREVLRSGIISVMRADSFGGDWRTHDDTINKIAYMLMQCSPWGFPEGLGVDVIPSLVQRSENARWLVDVIQRATGCTVEFRPGLTVSIDHQSHGEGSELFSDEAEMRRFLFSPASYLQTGNDNEDPYSY